MSIWQFKDMSNRKGNLLKILRLRRYNSDVYQHKGIIWIRGSLINHLKEIGFNLYTQYSQDSDFTVPILNAKENAYFPVFSLTFQMFKKAPEIIVLPKYYYKSLWKDLHEFKENPTKD